MTKFDTDAFRAELEKGGYTPVDRRMAPGESNEPHTHDVDVLLMVTEGEFTVTVNGDPRLLRPGDRLTMAAGCQHRERAGPEGVAFIAGRRSPK